MRKTARLHRELVLPRQLFELRDVIENPEGAPVRRGDELSFAKVNREVADLNARQIQREGLPLCCRR